MVKLTGMPLVPKPTVLILKLSRSLGSLHQDHLAYYVLTHFHADSVISLLVHVFVSYLTMHHSIVHPCVIFLYVHMAWQFPSTCRIFNSPHVVPWPIHVSCTGWSTYHIFIRSCGLSWIYRVEYNQFVIEVIWNHHYCTNWLHNYLD